VFFAAATSGGTHHGGSDHSIVEQETVPRELSKDGYLFRQVGSPQKRSHGAACCDAECVHGGGQAGVKLYFGLQ